MRFFFVAFLFVLVVAVSTVLAKVIYQGNVESTLEDSALRALREAGLEKVEIEFDHHTAKLSGFVQSEDEISTALELVKSAVPIANLPSVEETGLAIEPTLPPELEVTRSEDGGVSIRGILGEDGDSVRSLLGTRLHDLEGVTAVVNEIETDPKRLPLSNAAEFVSLAKGLVEHSATAKIGVSDGVLEVSGEVPNEGIKEALLDLAGRFGADETKDSIAVAPPETLFIPSSLSITRNRFGITVEGRVESAEARDRIAAVLEGIAGDRRFVERIEIDEKLVAAAWQANPEQLLPDFFSRFVGEATVEFGEKQIRLVGRTRDESIREEIVELAREVRDGSSGLEILSDVGIAASEEGPAVRLLAEYEGGLLTLTGNVPDESFVAALEARFETDYPGVLIKNVLEVTPSSPGQDWATRLRGLLEEIPGRVETARILIADGKIRLEGMAVDLADLQVMENLAVNAAASELVVENALSHADQPFPKPDLLPAERDELTSALSRIPVYFASGSDVVDAEGRKAVDSIFAQLSEAGAPVDLVVTGFADNVGNAEFNRQLSLRRADAVVAVLVSLGVDEGRMTTESRGEDVSGLSRSEQWKARRVEVSLATEDENGESEGAEESAR